MLTEIETAFGQRLAAMSGVPTIVWPNKFPATLPARPFLSVQHVPTSNDSPALSGGGEVQRGYFMVTVVIARDTFATPANTLAAAIKARFPKGLTLTAGSRKMRIWRPSQISAGFVDANDWRLPVRVDYLVTGA